MTGVSFQFSRLSFICVSYLRHVSEFLLPLLFPPAFMWCELSVYCETWFYKRSSFVSATTGGRNSCTVHYVSHSNSSFVISGIFLAAQCFNSHTFLELIYLNLSVPSAVLRYLLLVQRVTLHFARVYNPRQPLLTRWTCCHVGFKYLNSIIFQLQ